MDYSENLIKTLKEYGKIKFNEGLHNYTTFKTGGPADILIYPYGIHGISEIVKISKQESIPLTVIGFGSNLLISDKGIRGIVIRLSEDDQIKGNIKIQSNEEIYADAIIKKDDFINFAVNAGYEGVEFMAGIPGCIGGGIIMNAGTNIGTFVDILKSIDIIDQNGDFKTIEIKKEMSFYRKIDIGRDSIVAGAYFKLPKLRDSNSVKKRIDEILEERRKKHPLNYPSAGSVFKNPEGYFSWRLIDEAGLKGKTIGGAKVSELHTNFIINVNNAVSADIKNLIELIQKEVYKKYNIMLDTEIRMLGDF